MTNVSSGAPALVSKLSGSRRSLVAFSISLVMVMATVEATVVAAVLPSITKDLGGLYLYRWIVAAYMLANAICMPVFGRFADSHGRRPTFFTALFLFLAGSAASGAAPSMHALIVFRTLQGAGAGGLLVLAYTILGDIYTPAERAKIQGILAALWSAAGAAGPLLGVLILQVASWRWAFYVNVPLGLFVWLLIRATYDDTHVPRPHAFDVLGATLLGAAIGGILLSLGQHPNIAGFVASLALLALFVFHERRVNEPVLPLELLRRPSLAFPCCVDLTRIGVFYGTATYLPLLASLRPGGNAKDAGLVLVPIFIGIFVGSSLGGFIAHHILLHTFTRIALWVYSLAAILNAILIVYSGSPMLMRFSLFLFGVGLSAGSLGLVLTVQASAARAELGTATATLTLARYVGGALGVGLFGALMTTAGSSDGELSFSGSPALNLSLQHIFMAVASVAFVGAVITFWIPPTAKLTELDATPDVSEALDV